VLFLSAGEAGTKFWLFKILSVLRLKNCPVADTPSSVDATSDNRYDTRFDFDFAASLLLEIAQERSVERLIQKSIAAASNHPEFARVEFWLIEKEDNSRCEEMSQPADQTRCLRLVAAAENTKLGGARESSRFYDSEEWFLLGVGFAGKIAQTGQMIVLDNATRAQDEFPGLDLARLGKLRGCAGAPISFRDEILGVLTIFSYANITLDRRAWHKIFCDHVGAAIANARAFEEIQKLKTELEQQNAYLKEEVIEARAFGELVGHSAALRQISGQIDLVAPTDASVLILGETGTGKELVAHEIHSRSRRKDKPFIRVNCASIPKDLYESEFFGHARGAFTGAVKDRTGRFESAEGGTIFLDEIGEVPLELQSKLLRVLQEKSYERVGEDRTRRADVRIIAATNRDLKTEAAARRFREDLYYRLNVFPVQVAPLRERREDISLLAQHFINNSVKEMGSAKPRLTRAGCIQLQNYDWPGNVRELRNVIERAVILARGKTLEFDLPIRQNQSHSVSPKSRAESFIEAGFFTEAEMLQKERDNLERVLEKANWKVKGADGAAELMGVKPNTLLARIKKLGLKRPSTSVAK
jgi:transcriptional regulator with GAF, ATPase, and Fis domain